MLFLAIKFLNAKIPDAFTTKFSKITWELKLESTSWALFTHPTNLSSWYKPSAPSSFTKASITENS